MIGIKNLGYDQDDLFIESNLCVALFEEYNLIACGRGPLPFDNSSLNVPADLS